MATYLEIKNVIKDIFHLDADIDETCDILIPVFPFAPQEENILLANDELREAFDRMKSYYGENLELYKDDYREVALQFVGPFPRYFENIESIADATNGLNYALGPASSEYCIFFA